MLFYNIKYFALLESDSVDSINIFPRLDVLCCLCFHDIFC